MRIAHVAPVATTIPPPKSGSVEYMTSLLTEGLVKRGHDVTLFATGDSVTTAKLAAVYPQGYWHDESMWPWEFCEMTNLTEACQRAAEFDIIHYEAAYYPMSLPFMRLVKTPMVHTYHHYPDSSQIALWKHYPEANFVAISQCQYDAMAGLNRIGIVHHGIETDSFTFRAEPDDYLFFLGRFMPEKGSLQAVELAQRVGSRLLIAAPEDDYYHEAIEPHVDGKQIVFLGEVDHDEKNRLLGGARALLYPVQAGEPFGLVLVEAMACGTPVAALAKGAVTEIIVNGLNGYYADNLDQLAELLPKVVRLDRAAVRRDTVERFDKQRMVDDYIKMYERVLGG